jgi:hypothetical protein
MDAMDAIEVCGVVGGDFPSGTRIVLGVLIDPAQPEDVAPFTMIEEPRDGGTW